MLLRKVAPLLILLLMLPALVTGCGGHVAEHTTSAGATTVVTGAGGVQTIPDAGLQLTVPAGWSVSKPEDQLLINAPDGGVAVSFEVADPDQVAAAVADYKNTAQQRVQNLKETGGVRKDRLNGLERTTESGAGDTSSGPVTWRIDVVRARLPVVIFSMLTRNAEKADSAAYQSLLGSVKKMAGKAPAVGAPGQPRGAAK